jgi:hypothetical protein
MFLPDDIDVYISQENIDQGIMGSPGLCALSLAVLNVLPDEDNDIPIDTEGGELTFCYGAYTEGKRFQKYSFQLSDALCDFIESFDENKQNVKPIRMKLKVRTSNVLKDTMYHNGLGFVVAS